VIKMFIKCPYCNEYCIAIDDHILKKHKKEHVANLKKILKKLDRKERRLVVLSFIRKYREIFV